MGRRGRLRRVAVARVAAGFAVMAVSGLVWNSFALFLVPLQEEFGQSRGAVSAAFSAFALVNALTAPLVGLALARWDSRGVFAALSVLLGAGLLAASQASGFLVYALAFGLVAGVGAQSVSSFAVFAILARRARRRPATAMSVADAGSGFAAMAGLPLLQAIVDAHGWRAAVALLGVAALAVPTALHLLVFERVGAPRRAAAPAAPVADGGTGRALAALAACYFCGAVVFQGLLTQQVALLEGEDIPPDVAVWAASVAAGTIFLWRLGSGWLVDVLGAPRVMAIAAAAAVVAFAGLAGALGGARLPALAVYPLPMGVAFGGQQVVLAIAMQGAGPAAGYPQRLALGRLAAGLGMATGPVLAGVAYDVTGASAAVVALLAVFAAAHFATFVAGRMALRPRG